jgi:adenine-specific DNA methylase
MTVLEKYLEETPYALAEMKIHLEVNEMYRKSNKKAVDLLKKIELFLNSHYFDPDTNSDVVELIEEIEEFLYS